MGPDSWRTQALRLKREIAAISIAIRDPRTPWYARVLAAGIVAYALSPLDLIPDPIPVLGYLDDVILLPLAISLVIRLIPATVLADARHRAAALARSDEPRSWLSWVGAGVIAVLWIVAVGILVFATVRYVL